MDDTTTDTTPESDPSRRRRRSKPFHHQDLVDDYPDYLDDTLGYRFDARDVLPLAEIHRHDDLLHAPHTALAEVDLEALDDLQRWAVARNARRQGDLDAFLAAARLVLGGNTEHRAIAYDQAYQAVVGALIEVGRCDEAEQFLEQFRQSWPEEHSAQTLALRLAYRRDLQQGRASAEALAAAHPDDGELRYELAEDLLAMGRIEEAGRWLDEARAVAERLGDRPLQGDVALLGRRLNAAATPTE